MRVLRRALFASGVLVLLAALAFWLRPLDLYDDFTYLRQVSRGVQNRWATVNRYRMHYEVLGPAGGQPVVLVHGLGGSAEDWRALAPYLAKAGYRVYMPDLVGFGRSEQAGDFSYSIRDQASLVLEFFDHAGIRQADLGGWSMGGWVATVAASMHPERVKRLILFDAAGLYEKPAWDTRLFIPGTRAELDALDALLMPNPPRVPAFIAKDILRVSKSHRWVMERTLNQMWTGRDTIDDLLPQLKMPVLIEWGGLDRVVPVDQAEKMHRLVPRSQLEVYAGCGHLAPLQCAAAMGPDVVLFLKQPPVQGALAPSNFAATPQSVPGYANRDAEPQNH